MFSSACIKFNVNTRNSLSLIMSLAFVNITCFNIYTGDMLKSGSYPVAIIISTVTSYTYTGDMLKFATVARDLKFVYTYITHRKLSVGTNIAVTSYISTGEEPMFVAPR